MTAARGIVHLVKLSVGTDSIEDLAEWQGRRIAAARAAGTGPQLFHRTFQMPKRRAELIAGGSIYWVIKGLIQARQRVVDLCEGSREDGTPCCLIVLDGPLVAVRPTPRRPFQGWRYLDPADAPADIAGGDAGALADLPATMRKQLAELGLL